MKHVIIYFLLIYLPISAFGQINKSGATDVSSETLDKQIDERSIPNVILGMLICEDEYGKWSICSGSEFEKVKGFATSVPYVTANKVLRGQNKTEFVGIASISEGAIAVGDYLCPCEQNQGMVKKCTSADFPYAKALEEASTSGARLKVKVLGYRR